MATATLKTDESRPALSPRFEALVLDFLAHLEFERGLSRNTLSAYRTDLLQLGGFLAARDREATAATAQDLSDFLASLASGDGVTAAVPLLDRDDQPQGGLPPLLLPPPAPRGPDLRRPDGAARRRRGAERSCPRS